MLKLWKKEWWDNSLNSVVCCQHGVLFVVFVLFLCSSRTAGGVLVLLFCNGRKKSADFIILSKCIVISVFSSSFFIFIFFNEFHFCWVHCWLSSSVPSREMDLPLD